MDSPLVNRKKRLNSIKTIFLIFVNTAVLLIILDQIFLLSFGYSRQSFWKFAQSSIRQESAFRTVPELGFLLDPEKKDRLHKLARSEQVPEHSDYLLNEMGFRLLFDGEKEEKKQVNVYGDSFTFGLFLRENETITHHLNQNSTNCHFRNYGVPAFDFLQMMDLSNSELVKPTEYQLFLLIRDDLYRITRKIEVHPFGRETSTQDLISLLHLNLSPFLHLPIPNFLFRNSFFAQNIYKIQEHNFWQEVDASQLAEKLIQLKIKPESLSKSVFIHLPTADDYRPSAEGLKLELKKIPEFFEKHTIGPKEHSSPEAFTKLFFPGDPHYNAEGSGWAAFEISKKIQSICHFRSNWIF